MGSVPMNKKKLTGMSVLLSLALFLLIFLLSQFTEFEGGVIIYLLAALAGLIFYGVKGSKYRNASARHYYEKETKNKLSNVKKKDELIEHRTNLSDSTMAGANNRKLEGEYATIKENE